MTNATSQNLTLVLGATGKTGRRVTRQLEELGVPMRIGSRSAEIPFEWNDPSTWAAVLQDVHSIYIVYFPDLAVPGAADTIQAFTDAAVEAGVKHLVLLAGRGEEEADRCEKIVQNSGIDWTILRPTWFSQNFSEGFMRDQILTGTLALPATDVLEPFVDVDDIADVAVAALIEPKKHAGQVYELTGPRLMTFADVAGEISRATGERLDFVSVPLDAYKAGMKEQGVPDDFVWLIGYLFTEVLDGRNSHLTDGVQRALGREPRDFAEYARNAAAAGFWAKAGEEVAA